MCQMSANRMLRSTIVVVMSVVVGNSCSENLQSLKIELNSEPIQFLQVTEGSAKCE
jgi:hypothetical protein